MPTPHQECCTLCWLPSGCDNNQCSCHTWDNSLVAKLAREWDVKFGRHYPDIREVEQQWLQGAFSTIFDAAVAGERKVLRDMVEHLEANETSEATRKAYRLLLDEALLPPPTTSETKDI